MPDVVNLFVLDDVLMNSRIASIPRRIISADTGLRRPRSVPILTPGRRHGQPAIMR